MKNFFSNVLATFRGALIGQIIPVLAMPIISRLYAPDVFGVFASILSISIILTAILMMQLDVASVLPKNDDEAGRVARAAVQIGTTFTVLFTFVLIIAQPWIIEFKGLTNLGWWVALTPLLSFLMAGALLGNYLSLRLRAFRDIGRSAAALQLFNCTFAIILGLFTKTVPGLVSGRITGQIAAIATYRQAFHWIVMQFKQHGPLNRADIWSVLKKYKKFPLFTLPQTLISMLAREGVTVILIFFHQPHVAGFYALVRSILMMPVSLLSTSVGQIFYHEASNNADDPDFQSFSYSLMIAIACLITPGCLYIANWGPEIFAFVFGGDWGGAGIYAMLFMPISFMMILTTWAGRIFEVRNKQDILFALQFTFDTLSIGTLTTLLFLGHGPIAAITGYAICQVAYLLIYLGFIFNLLHLQAKKFLGLIATALVAILLQLALHKAVLGFGASLWISFVAETLLTAAAIITMALFLWHKFRNNPVAQLAFENKTP